MNGLLSQALFYSETQLSAGPRPPSLDSPELDLLSLQTLTWFNLDLPNHETLAPSTPSTLSRHSLSPAHFA